MNPPALSSARVGPNQSRVGVWLGWIFVLTAIGYFVTRNVPRYFIVTPESYGTYQWPKVSWLLPHVASGLLALLIGPLQFWPRIRTDFPQAHRIAGRIYVIAVLVGTSAAFGLAVTIKQNIPFAIGLSGLALAWITTTSMAFVAIRRKNILQHRQWMVRSFVVTFAFVTFRLASDLVSAAHALPNKERQAVLAWACWAVPLLITEVALQAPAVFKPRT
jgi:uncharacterized membrane protein